MSNLHLNTFIVLITNYFGLLISLAYCKRGEEIFTQLAELATTCRNLMADFRSKLANEEMMSHNVHPGKR